MKNVLSNVVEKIKSKRCIHYVIIIIIGLLVSIPFFWVQICPSDDGAYHFLRIIGLDFAIKNGEFPYLVYPFFCSDWGYSMATFYPQIVTYIPYILGLIAGSFMNGLKIFSALTVILSGVFMYNFVNEVTKKKGIALLSAIIYMILPYRFENVFNRYAIGEFTAFVFIPLVFQGLYNLLKGDKKRHYYIAIGAIGLILTHTISTLYTAIFCVVYILFNIKSFWNKDVIKKCFINLIFILLISAFYLIPVIEFESTAKYAIFDSRMMRTNGTRVSESAIEPWQFLKDIGEENGVSFIIGIPFLTMLVIGILSYGKLDKKTKDFYIVNLILGIIALFMCTKYFPWKIMPDFLCTLQYPWRMLGIGLFFLTPLCAINVYNLVNLIKKEWIRNIVYLIVLTILAVFTIMELKAYPNENSQIDEIYEASIKNNPRISCFGVNRDNLPVKSMLDQEYLRARTDETYVLNGQIEIVQEEKDGLHLVMDFKNAQKGTELELPYFLYPGYAITLDTGNETIKLEAEESDHGFIKVTIPEDISEGKITVDYTGTTLEKASYVISAISVIGFVAYIVWYRKRINKDEE